MSILTISPLSNAGSAAAPGNCTKPVGLMTPDDCDPRAPTGRCGRVKVVAPIDADDFGVTGASTGSAVDGLTETPGSPPVITLFTVTGFRRHTARLPTIRTR